MQSEGKRVYVTGATGFIGQRLIPRLLEGGHQVTALVRRPERASRLRALGVQIVEGDVTRPDGLANSLCGADWLIHLANHYTLHERDPQVYRQVNVEGNRHVLQAALQAGVGKVVHVSSGVSYGVSPDQPLREDSRVGRHPNSYWRTKFEGDEVVWDFARRGLPVVVLYPGGVLGAGDPNATGAYVRRLVRRQQPFRVFDRTGFTYVHVADVAEAIVRATDRDGNSGERYLIGQEFLTGAAFAALVAEVSGVPAPRLVLPDGVAFTLALGLEALERLTGVPPRFGFSGQTARHLAAGFHFGSDKAERELGLRYTPIRDALAENLRSLGLPVGSTWAGSTPPT